MGIETDYNKSAATSRYKAQQCRDQNLQERPVPEFFQRMPLANNIYVLKKDHHHHNQTGNEDAVLGDFN